MSRLYIKRTAGATEIVENRVTELEAQLAGLNAKVERQSREANELYNECDRLASEGASDQRINEAKKKYDQKRTELAGSVGEKNRLAGQLDEERAIFENLKTALQEKDKKRQDKESTGGQGVKGKEPARGKDELGGKVEEHSTMLLKHTDSLGHLSTVQAEHTKQLTEHGTKLAEHDKDIQGLKKASPGLVSISESHYKDDDVAHQTDQSKAADNVKNDQIKEAGTSKSEASEHKPEKDHEIVKSNGPAPQGFNAGAEEISLSHENGPSADKNEVPAADTSQPKDETSKNDKPATSTSDEDLSHPLLEQPPTEAIDRTVSPAKESDGKNPSGPEDREQRNQKYEPQNAAEESVNGDGTNDKLDESAGQKKDAPQTGPILPETQNLAPDVDERLNEIETKHDTLHNKVLEVDKKTAKVEQHDLDITKIVDTQDTHGEKIDDHAAKLEHHHQKIEQHDQKIEHQDLKVEHHDQMIQKVEGKTNEHGEKIGQLIKTTTNHGENIAVHNVHLDYHKDDITNLKHKADTQATTTASFGAQLGYNAEKFKEVDQVKHGLDDMGKQLFQHKSDIEYLRDRTQLLEKDVRKIEVQDERLRSLQSNVADYKGLISDVQAKQQYQTAQLLALKEKTEKPVTELPSKGKVNIGLITGLGGGVLAIGALIASAYIWWKKRESHKNAAKAAEEVSDEEGQGIAIAAINTDVIDSQGKGGRRVRPPRVRGGGRLHAREWHPDTTFDVHSF